MADLREALKENLDGVVVDAKRWEKVEALIDNLLENTKKAWVLVECKHCHREGKYFADVPDRASAPATVKALVALLDSVNPKPPVQVNVGGEITYTHIHEMPDAELRRLAGGAIDAEFTEVTPELASGEG